MDPNGLVSTIAGTSELPRGQSLFAFGDVDATGASSRFQHPLGVAWNDGFVFVADTYNHKIRKVDVQTGETTTWLGTGKAGNTLSELNEPSGLSIANGKLYIADTNNHRILAADLITRQVSVLSLDGVMAPQPKVNRSIPNFAKAIAVADQAVGLTDAVTVVVDLKVPADHKLNDLAPVSWQVFVIEGDQMIADSALQGSMDAMVEGKIATFKIPMLKTAGTVTMAVELSYGYCGVLDSDVCKLANGLWKFSLVASEDSQETAVRLDFPSPDPN